MTGSSLFMLKVVLSWAAATKSWDLAEGQYSCASHRTTEIKRLSESNVRQPARVNTRRHSDEPTSRRRGNPVTAVPG